MFLALLLFLGAAGLIFAYLGETSNTNGTGAVSALKTGNFEKSVNKHLMLTNEKMAMQRQRMQLENAQLTNSQLNSPSAQPRYVNEGQLDLSSENNAAEIANDLGRGERFEEITAPQDLIQKELFNEQQMQEYSKAYKEEYARQFVENARRGGYKVILSEDLSRVLSVKPLRDPNKNSMELFNSGSEPLQ